MNTSRRRHHPDDPSFVVGDRVKWWTDAAGAQSRYEHGVIVHIFGDVLGIDFDNKVLMARYFDASARYVGVNEKWVEFEADSPPLPDDYFA